MTPTLPPERIAAFDQAHAADQRSLDTLVDAFPIAVAEIGREMAVLAFMFQLAEMPVPSLATALTLAVERLAARETS